MLLFRYELATRDSEPALPPTAIFDNNLNIQVMMISLVFRLNIIILLSIIMIVHVEVLINISLTKSMIKYARC